MIIAVASGKGGTGKTFIAVNLAAVLEQPVQLLDCDVEEPNAHLFFNENWYNESIVTMPIPLINADNCDTCNDCVSFCRFNALASAGNSVLLFPELCHSCGGCVLLCHRQAITETAQRIGNIRTLYKDSLVLKSGCLDVGSSMTSALINKLRQQAAPDMITLLDAPPGTACQTVTTLRNTDFVILVTDSTAFGLHDLTLAVDTTRELKIPFGVVINRAITGDDRIQQYCAQESIPVLLEIPDDRRIAEVYSRGQLIVKVLPEYRTHFLRLWTAIAGLINTGENT
ncbi:nucleotide-binding protein [Escherichia albertii]|uniref:nucleotide-binding protein n=1 Tax=Escherichia albertii TaxID=208962 RepID=UPI0007441DA6|nr:ATP-binding protein [Escherichia albertii]